MSTEQLASMRRNYTRDGLLEKHAPTEPFALFKQWFADAVATEQPPVEPNSMMLATVDSAGHPHCRMLLLKGLDARGFVFYSNYESAKGRQLAEQPVAAMTFFWPALERQVRIEGSVERVSDAESDAYYNVRPLGSRLGAWASEQSRPLTGREELEAALQEVEQRYANNPQPPRPAHWGGFRLMPKMIEFWQGRTCRLHDRLRYSLEESQQWRRERLAP
ncbi:pyridoxamine 5'-phosphate oxidase [Denitrificimonas sp. JX-1]|uniref:Pyridoxine/pyridoxamine 5'-phosphate oxidase n=1 Tax=Denitrificimonas halotolerans TaxID=3098930 RepID=A0ABU5GRJ0_9GAMM|nr:pyridoxamine 5'-phosphate oxidase [Denitrificimonas sp. JX-1]MDY7218821.1 pyridoxamine 5'-phosphate oxidase [Denitrificimonas sp. JX-1]